MDERMLILGAGPAGATAAIYAGRANLSPLILTGVQAGGQLTLTTDVENYPGFEEAVLGPDLMERMHKQAERFGARLIADQLTEIDLSVYPYRGIGEREYRARSVVIATGAQARWLNLESEAYFRGYGVSACATCDGFFFRNKRVAVIGGGNTACEEALFLTKFASEVMVIHRRDQLRSEKILQDRVFNDPKITIVWNKVVQEIIGKRETPPAVTGIRLRDVLTAETQEYALDGVFIAIGHDPATDLFRDQLAMDSDGYILTRPDSTVTSCDGVFAAGDVKDKTYRQAVTAAGMGCMAALEAERWLSQS